MGRAFCCCTIWALYAPCRGDLQGDRCADPHRGGTGHLIAVDCSRKAASASSLEELHEDAMGSCRDFTPTLQSRKDVPTNKNTPVIITLCMTGEGGAVQMKSYLEKNAGSTAFRSSHFLSVTARPC